MAKISEIISNIETIAPLATQEAWDNSGWQIKLENDKCKKVLIALSATENVLKQAIDGEFNLLITHHPLLFEGIKQVNESTLTLAIQNNIQVYSLHTNFDKADGGTSTILAKKIGFETTKFNDFVRIAKIDAPINFDELMFKIKNALNIKYIKITNKKTQFKSIAFCAGSGGDFIHEIQALGADAFITGDIKYHEALDCKGITLFDVGHFESEVIALETIKNIVQKTNVEAVIANEEPVFEII